MENLYLGKRLQLFVLVKRVRPAEGKLAEGLMVSAQKIGIKVENRQTCMLKRKARKKLQQNTAVFENTSKKPNMPSKFQ